MGLVGYGLGIELRRVGSNYRGKRATGNGKRSHPTFPVSRFPCLYVLFFKRISPFTVLKFSVRPPFPMVPRSRRGPNRPEIVNG